MEVDSCSIKLRQMHTNDVSSKKKIISQENSRLVITFFRIFRNRESVLKIIL